MAILADKPKEALRHTVLAYGPSKAGKTESVGKLATLGYNLHWFDVEDGALTLSKLPEEAKRRINLYSIKDTAENSYAAKTLLKTNLKKFDAAIAEGDRETAVSAYKVAVKTVDHAASKHLIHKNCAANKKSKLTLKLNDMQ